MAQITRTGYLTDQNTGTANVALVNPPGAAEGNRMLLVMTVSAVAANITTPSGWTVLADRTYNSRRTYWLTRDYAASYPNIVLSTSATAGWVISSYAPASGYALTPWTVGPMWDRPTNGGGAGVNTTMLSMTGQADGLTLAITGETSTAAETEPQVTFTGTDWTKWFYADASAADPVAANFWFGYRNIGAVASGNVITTWPNSSNNSVGLQLSLGQTATGPAPTGNLDTVGVYGNTATSLTVGARLIGSGAVVAVLSRNSAEVERKTISFTSGRGNVTFTGLPSGAWHSVAFEVDGVVQTDAAASGMTLRTGVSSFSAVSGSCMFTGSTHPVFDRIAAEGADFWTIQGDAHYEDASTAAGWWGGMVTGLNAWRGLARKLVTRWTPDNHDTIRTTPLGGGAPELPPIWKQIAGSANFGSDDSVGQAWQNGRVLFVQPDLRSARDNYQTVAEPRKMLGDAQKAWFKGLLAGAEADPGIAAVVWFDNWIGLKQGSGRWGDYLAEYDDLNSTIQASAWLKSHLVLIGGDTHNLWADSGARNWAEAAFPGIPSLNISGYNRASPAETFFIPDIANATIQTSGAEADWGSYSLITVADDGTDLTLKWDGVRVSATNTRDVMATWSRTFTSEVNPQPWLDLQTKAGRVEALYAGAIRIWP